MSDISQGRGWWLASDGKWYPPQAPAPPNTQSHPAYRACPACQSPVLRSAVVCVQCGSPLSTPRSKGAAVLLAVFLSFWAWLYTYKADATKFWCGLGLALIGVILTVFLVGIPILFGVWIWSIIDTAVKPEQWYQLYPGAPQPVGAFNEDFDSCPNGHPIGWDQTTCPYCGADAS